MKFQLQGCSLRDITWSTARATNVHTLSKSLFWKSYWTTTKKEVAHHSYLMPAWSTLLLPRYPFLPTVDVPFTQAYSPQTNPSTNHQHKPVDPPSPSDTYSQKP